MAQSLQTVNPEYYQHKYETKLLKLAQKENLWQRFMLGEKMDTDVFLHTSIMLDKVYPINCEVKDYIWDKIEGKLQDKCPPKKQGFYVAKKMYEQVYEQPKSCDIIEQCVPKIEW